MVKKISILGLLITALLIFTSCLNIFNPFIPTYTVIYNGNNHTSGNVPLDTNNYEQEAEVTILGNIGNLVRTDYTFADWNTQSDGTGTNYAVGDTFSMGNADVTLYAKWSLAAAAKETYTANGVSFKMSYVPGGEYIIPIGTGDSRRATVNDSYWIGVSEVTYELWEKVYNWATSSGGYSFANTGRQGGTNNNDSSSPVGNKQHPVTTINWQDAMVWSNALTEWYNAQNGTCLTIVYKDNGIPIRDSRDSNIEQCNAVIPEATATGFRLLTSNEWEFAARWRGDDRTNTVYIQRRYTDPWFTKGNSASGATADYNNAAATGAVAWYCSNSDSSTHEVKGKIPNTLGLYDMSGNIREWCFDCNPLYSEYFRVSRGGSWGYYPIVLQIGYVYHSYQVNVFSYVGFRLARSAE